MEKEVINKKQVTTHRYWIQAYIPVFSNEEMPEDEDAYYNTYEDALSEMEQSKFIQPENIYAIKTIRIKSKDENVSPDIKRDV